MVLFAGLLAHRRVELAQQLPHDRVALHHLVRVEHHVHHELRSAAGQDVTEIRADESLKDLPVVVLTASTDEEDRTQSERLQVESYLTKPVDVADILRLIELEESPQIREFCWRRTLRQRTWRPSRSGGKA